MHKSEKKIVVLGSLAESLINFRGSLLRAMVNYGHIVTACAPDIPAKVREQLNSFGVICQNVPFKRTGLNPIQDLISIYSLVLTLRQIKPDILFSYTIKPVIYGSIAARLAGVEQVFSMITGLGYVFTGDSLKQRMAGSIARVLYKFALGGNKKVFFQNSDDRALFIDLALLRKVEQAVLISGSGVDTDYYSPTILPSQPSFLLIARLLRDKGVCEYAEAAHLLKKKYPGVSFRLVGWIDENPSAISKKHLDFWANEGIIEFLGRLDDVRPAIASSTVYVLPSYREGTPRTVLEAMAMGRPIITTDAPGCRETVKEGQNGFHVPVKDVVVLAKTMEKFIIDPSLAVIMGQRSREMALEKYDVHKVNAKIMRALELSNE